ncbi:MAG: DUF4038 domain-containing protein [Clostridia bacterium]|nr:DUF4038 domain-containing protein [Clostridia bacterium]
MTKFVSFFLSILIMLNSGFIQSGKAVQSFFDSFGVPYCFVGRAVANIIRDAESKKDDYPEEATYKKKVIPDDTDENFAKTAETTINTETWLANELTFESEKSYADPFNDVDVDLILVGNGVKLTIPAFWDGGNVWKVRFACPSEGQWLYETTCTDKENTSLNGRAGKVICSQYGGEYDVYRHGFVTTSYGKKYMTYDDGTPFFYLGDTHWSLGDETVDMVKTISAKRAEQGFTVMQSEPIGATFDFANGITEQDIDGLRVYDEKFKAIAEKGLTHANAEFFFPAYMSNLIDNMGGFSSETVSGQKDGKTVTAPLLSDNVKHYLEKISRYWVARYSAYPVMWTLGQEVDRDFYSRDDNHPLWNFLNNPYKLVADYIYKYDAYSHPLTAHQENSGGVTAYGKSKSENLKKYADTEPSLFRDSSAHNWYGAQWSPSLKENSNQKREKDYWYNSQGKPVINYEGRYCYLWTKNFGSRMQGWASYLSGMFGYGWGAHDTWSYLNTYDEENDTSDGIDTITSEEKINATWQDALEYESSYQMGYMKEFFSSMNWWELVPRFNNILYFDRDVDVYAYAASNSDNSQMVIYFYNFSDNSVGQKPNGNDFTGRLTGRIGSLEPSTVYHYKWFNPLTGEYSQESTFTSTPFGTYEIGQKQSCDMVFYMYK